MKRIVIFISLIFPLFAFKSCYNEPCYPVDVDVLLCEDYKTMPEGHEDYLLRITSILPNPVGEDSANEEITIKNYTHFELDLSRFYLITDGYEEINLTSLATNIDDNYMLGECDSIKLTLKLRDFFPNKNSTIDLQGYRETICKINYENPEEGQIFYFKNEIE